jgi:hypothetical protein
MADKNAPDEFWECGLPPELARLVHPSARESSVRGSDREELAPEVDERLIRALVRRELAEEDARAVYRFVHAFDSWNRAHTRIVIDEFHKRGSATREDGE